MPKCQFEGNELKYLCHIVFGEGVATDSNKIQTIVDWPISRTVRVLREYLGLTSNYRRFIWDYAKLLLLWRIYWRKMASSGWSRQRMPSKPWKLQWPVHRWWLYLISVCLSSCSVTLVVMVSGQYWCRGGSLIAFASRMISERTRGLSTYDTELMVIVNVVCK